MRFDARQFQYIGAPYAEATVLVVTKKSGITSLDDILGPNAKEASLGGISTGSPNDVAAILLRDVLGGKVRLVTGYQGTSRIRLAMDGGEVDGMFNGWASLNATSHDKLQSGEYKVLIQVSPEPIKELGRHPFHLTARQDRRAAASGPSHHHGALSVRALLSGGPEGIQGARGRDPQGVQ